MSKQKKVENKQDDLSLFDKIEKKYVYIIAVAIILIPLLYTFSPYLFDDLRPIGTDIVASTGQTNLYKQWENETGERALWNPNIFSGMPTYPRIVPQIILFDSLIVLLDQFSYWAFFYFIVGATGMFFLLFYRKIPWQFALIIAIAFSLLPDWQALLGDGHFTKLRAVMVLPWLILSFNYFIDKNNWFGTAAFSLMFAWMFRTQHFQIVFYAILILFFLFIFQYIKMYVDKQYKQALSLTLKFVVAIALTVVTAAQPFLSIQEYSPYSTRGGNPLKIGDKYQTAVETGGVDLTYATQWSLAPSEVMDFFVQRFHGGISNEIYDGDKYSQFKGQQVPGYWGQKPFSGNYHYFGMILFIFAILGLIKNYKDPFVMSLGVFAVFSLLLAFGRHFIELYQVFYYIIPYFSKFRAPSMLANITFISFLILSGYGLKSLLEMKHPQDTKLLVSVLGSSILFAGIILLMKDSLSYLGPNEAGRYEPQTIDLLKDIRKEFLTADAIKLLIITFSVTAATLAFFFRKLKKDVFIIVLLILVFIELLPANKKAAEKIDLDNIAKVEASVFQENELTKFLKGRNENNRLLVLGREFQSNHYTYFYPTINGYSAIKMQVIQDVIEHILYNSNSHEKINWNVINMLNGKYIIADGMIDKSFLIRNASSQATKQVLYENTNALPKAWFVKTVKQFETPENVAFYMNDTSFNPSSEALVLKKEELKQTEFSGEGTIDITEYNPNKIALKTVSDSGQFLVLSELYYPAWKVSINGTPAEIIKTNHLLRGIELPAGTNSIEFVIESGAFDKGMNLSWIGNFITLGMLAFGFFFEIRKKNTGN